MNEVILKYNVNSFGMSLVLNLSQLFHHLAMAKLFKNRFNLKTKHKQTNLTYILKLLQ